MIILTRLILLIIAAQVCGLHDLQAQLPLLIPSYQSGKGGFSDSTGRMIVPALYDRAYLLRNGIGMVMRYADNPANPDKPLELFGLYDSTGNMIYPPQSASQPDFRRGAYIVVSRQSDKTLLYGLIDRRGNAILPCEYNHYRSFQHGFLYFRRTDTSEIIHINDGSPQKYILSANIKEIKSDQEQALFTIKTRSDNVGLIDKSGTMLIDTVYRRLYLNKFGFVVAEAHSAYSQQVGVLNVHGDTIVPLKYRQVKILAPNLIAGVQYVARDFNRIYLYDDTGRLLTERPVNIADSIGHGRILTERFGDLLSVRADGRTSATSHWDNPLWYGFASYNPLYPSFRDGYTVVTDSLSQTIYLDPDGNPYTWPDTINTLIDERRIHTADRFKHGWTSFSRNDSSGLINIDGRELFFGKYDSFAQFGPGRLLAVDDTEEPINPDQVNFRQEYWLVDTNGRVINGEPWSMCRELHDGRALFSPRYGKLYGYIDARGVEIIAPQFQFALPFSEGLAIVKPDSSQFYGAIDSNGVFVVPARYDKIDGFDNGRAAVYRQGLWTLIDNSGHELHPPSIRFMGSFKHGILCGKINKDTVACLNREGKKILRMAGAEIEIVSPQRIAVDSTQLFNSTGAEILPRRFDAVRHVADSIVAVRINGLWQLTSLDGEPLSPELYDDIRPFVGELASVRRGMWTIIDRDLQEVKAPQFERVEHIDDTHALCRRPYEVQLRGRDNQVLATFHDTTLLYKRLYYARTAIRCNGRLGIIDTNAQLLMPMVFDGTAAKERACDNSLFILRNGLTFLYKNGQGQVFDSTGLLIVSADSIGQICLTNSDLICRYVGNNTEQFQIFNRRLGTWSPQFWTDCSHAGWGISRARTGDRFALFNKDGERLGESLYEEVVTVRNGAVIVKSEGKYGVVNLDGTTLIDMSYDKISTLRDNQPVYFQLVKDNKRFVADKTGTILGAFDNVSSILMVADDMLIVRRKSASGVARLDGTYVVQKTWDKVSEVSPGLFTCSNSGANSVLLDKYGRIYSDINSLRR